MWRYLLFFSLPLVAATLPTGFVESAVASGVISNATAFDFAPDGRIFVCEQGGAVRVIKNGVLLATPFITFSVDAMGERGLLGVAFDPDFSANQFVYFYYTVSGNPRHNRVVRVTASGDQAPANSEVLIFRLNDLGAATNHNGGGIHFGLDGKLYIGVGENATSSNSQTLTNLLGKMLRINKDGSIPLDNPFLATTTGDNQAIWALGLRNPFTFAVQPGSGRILINDVGQSAFEEIDDGIAGANYGWPTTEGPTSSPQFRTPLFSYGHGNGSDVGCAISGGAFYNPPTMQFPADYIGKYFFADLCSGWIRVLNLADNTVTGFATGINGPVDLRTGPDGALYYLSRGTGMVFRVSSTLPPPQGLRFVPVTPCRIIDTRLADGPFGGPSLAGGATRNIAVPQSACGIPSNASAYSVNVTVVPGGALGYLTLWASGQTQPYVSTLNSLDGRIKANAAIVPAGTNGAVSVYVTHTTHVILDINGYFIPPSGQSNLVFYPVTPCRISDTRSTAGPFGGPSMSAGQTRSYSVPSAACAIPAAAQAYALNMTVVPSGPLNFLTTWPTGQQQPIVSTLNAPTGAVTANAAIVPAGAGGAINVYVTNPTDLIIDINGYFAPPGSTGELLFYAVNPCRISDTRNATGPFGGPALGANLSRTFPIAAAACGLPSGARAYSLNATVVPNGPLLFLTMWATGQAQPVVSTLNSFDATIVSNAAIVPAGTSGSVNAYVSNQTDLILDTNGYFAP